MGFVVLGIDPGSHATGYGVVERDGARLRLLEGSVIRARESMQLADRLELIHRGVSTAIERFSPSSVAVEGIFYGLNARSALLLGHARGVVLLAISQHGLSLHEYSPLEVKKAVVGYGAAQKHQVQKMVKLLLGLSVEPAQDAADAMAVAICHCNSTQWQIARHT